MNSHLLQRLQLLLQLVKDDRLCVTARENLAAAKELVDTAHVLGDIDHSEYRHLRSLCTHAHIDVSNDELDRARATITRPDARPCEYFSDGVRPAVSEDGAYRFNPMTGCHE